MKQINYEKYWSPAFNAMSEFVYILDTNFNLLKVNKAVIDFTKKNECSLIGKKCFKAIHGGNKDVNKNCPYKRMLMSKKNEAVETFIPHAKKWLYIRATPIFDDENNLIGGITFSEDITKRKKIEEEKEKLLKAVKNAKESVCITTLKGNKFRTIYTNNAFDKLFGYKKGEFIGKDITLINAISKRDKLTKEIVSTLAKKGVWEGEIPNVKKDGTEFLSFVTISIIKDNKGQISGSIATQHDITKHRKSENALRKSEEAFRVTFENAKDAIFWADIETGKVIKCNKAAEKLVERNRKEIIGNTQVLLFPPDKTKFYNDMFRRHLKVGGGFDEPAEVITKSGKIKPILITSSFCEIGEEKIMWGIFHDVTERKKMEDALIESKNIFEKFFENQPAYAYMVSTDGIITNMNKAALKTLGYKKSEIIGKNLKKIYAKEVHSKSDKIFAKWKRTGKIENEEMAIITKHGEKRIVLLSVDSIKNKEGKIQYSISLQKDITEHKKAELAIKESEEKFRTVSEQSPNMIFINKRGRIVYVNKKCEEVMGYKKEEFYSPDFDFRKLIAPEFMSMIEGSFHKHMEGKSVFPYEYTLFTKDGRRIEAILTTKLIDYKGDKAILGILTDISDRKKLEQIKDNLICDISHSLKTPIAIAAMALEASKGAMQVNDLAQMRRSHAIAQSNIKKARKDVNNILEIFTLETGRIGRKNNKKGKASLSSVVNEVLKGLNYLIVEKGLKISTDIPENAKNVEIYRKDAIILINNILDNAIKFTKKGGISIKSRLKGNEIEIAVKDTGLGIEAKDINKVFDKFYRCHSAVDGSGLGLAICKSFADIYRGKIEARSKGKGRGTTMIIRLPKW